MNKYNNKMPIVLPNEAYHGLMVNTLQYVTINDPDGELDGMLREMITQLVKKIDAPMAHKLAVGVSEVSEEDVVSEFAMGKDCLDMPFGGCTPLDLATLADNVKGLDWLLRMGADPNNKAGTRWPNYDRDFHPGEENMREMSAKVLSFE